MSDIELMESNDPLANPWRVALLRPDRRTNIHENNERYVMTFPHLIVREVILFQLVVIALSLTAIFFDAPLESIANPLETPNPAKAPWYFLGLQELLHYFPPIVAGVLLPTLVVVALLVIPYARVNLTAGPLWQNASRVKLPLIVAVIAGLTILFGAFQCWPVVIPTVILGAAAVLARSGRPKWLAIVTLPEWIMTWFVVVAAVLTAIGTFFRGPGWSWVWPWGG
jgi:quinol---cytochrome c reductase cytochrome c subunit, bacillus type